MVHMLLSAARRCFTPQPLGDASAFCCAFSLSACDPGNAASHGFYSLPGRTTHGVATVFFFFLQGQTPRLGHRGSATAMPQPRTGPGSRAQVPRAQEKVRSFSITPCGTYSRDSALSAVRLLIDPDSRGHFSGAILPQRYRLLLHDATCMVKCCRSLLIVARL